MRKTALVIILATLTVTPLPAQQDAPAACSSDLLYQQSLRSMQSAARRARVTIDTDIDIYIGPENAFIFTTIDGFEDHDPLRQAENGLQMGMIYVNKFETIPTGFYVMEVFIDPDDLKSAYVSLVNTRGDRYDYALEIPEDPYPRTGAAQRLDD